MSHPMSRRQITGALALLLLPVLAGCAALPGLAVLGPGGALASPADNAAWQQRRGAVELIVKGEQAAVLTDIATGGGPTLTRAMDAARIPAGDRAARVIQLEGDRGLYEVNPGALVSALMLYGS